MSVRLQAQPESDIASAWMPLDAHLVPHYNGLTNCNIKALDESLKIAAAGVLKALAAQPPDSHRQTFEGIRSRLLQLALLEPRSASPVLSKFVKLKGRFSGAPMLLNSQASKTASLIKTTLSLF
jgi:hypothetical protein